MAKLHPPLQLSLSNTDFLPHTIGDWKGSQMCCCQHKLKETAETAPNGLQAKQRIHKFTDAPEVGVSHDKVRDKSKDQSDNNYMTRLLHSSYTSPEPISAGS